MSKYHEIPKPPVFRGTEEERWRELRNYLWRVAEQIEHIINNQEKEGEKSGNI